MISQQKDPSQLKGNIMTDETNERARSVLGVNAMSVAMAVGHVAALALVTQMREGGPEENELYYRMFAPLEEGTRSEADIEMLAQYVCGRPDNVSGEQLFRKAAELAVHDAPASSFFDQAYEVQMGYRLFARSCRLVFIDLQMEQREEQSRLDRFEQVRKPIPIEDQTYAADDAPLAKDPVHEAAQKALAELPRTKSELGVEAYGEDTEDKEEEAAEPESPLSIGERPVAHQGQPKRGGARVPKTTQK